MRGAGTNLLAPAAHSLSLWQVVRGSVIYHGDGRPRYARLFGTISTSDDWNTSDDRSVAPCDVQPRS